jgi:peptide/nickel transport system substrate-binding protein
MNFVLGMLALLVLAMPARADDTPKHGGTLTFMIPADAPPSLDGHKETTYRDAEADG